ncbi:hypothetical protein LN429_15585 [Pseudomonas syringae]|uniref:hypothetical protein n=1 Tax=Pseudomonas syringae TaxID=317 RepID=UPI00234C42A6|nr:hypothetical protein [Pseudomonas syringae]MDC6536526.1 hypothetical protein [Pseudomonas syringae]
MAQKIALTSLNLAQRILGVASRLLAPKSLQHHEPPASSKEQHLQFELALLQTQNAALRRALRNPQATLVIWFEDLKACQAGAAPGMPEAALEMILGVATTLERRYIANGVVHGVKVILPETICEHFASVLRDVGHRHGTRAWIRNYSEPAYAKAWDGKVDFFN